MNNIQQSKQEELEIRLNEMLDTNLTQKETTLEELGFITEGDFTYYTGANDNKLENLRLVVEH